MPRYAYKVKDRQGETITGQMEAPNENIVQEALGEKDWIVLAIKEVTVYNLRQKLLGLTHRVSTKELVIFSRQLAVLVSANVSIVRALRILAKQTSSKYLFTVITSLADEVDGGVRLSAAMHKFPHIFDDFFVYMTRAGETTGRLDEVLTYLANQKEKDYELMSRVLIGMIYPAFILLALITMFIVMMIFVMPKLLDVVVASGAELPFMTQVLLAVSHFFQNYWIVVVILVVVFIILYLYGRSTPVGKQMLDRAKLRIPVLGTIFYKMYLARIARSLANLLSSGVPVNRSLEIVADVVGNEVYRSVLRQTLQDIEAGVTLSESFKRSAAIPPMMTQMMVIGEETGRLDYILGKIEEFYARDVESLSRILTNLVEPVIIILIGIGAAVVVTGILMPVYSATSNL